MGDSNRKPLWKGLPSHNKVEHYTSISPANQPVFIILKFYKQDIYFSREKGRIEEEMQEFHEVPVVILCGGEGTRLREETEFKPKPLVEIGGIPILVHIMKIYATQGSTHFILCLGYKGDMIKRYFLEHRYLLNDFTLDTASDQITFHNHLHLRGCKITFAETGRNTLTAGRVKQVAKYLTAENFMLTYGDGVADINLPQLWKLHQEKNKICTITAVNPVSKYGLIRVNQDYEILDFAEKPPMQDIINGGFMVMKKTFLEYIGSDCMLESKVLPRLSRERQVVVYHHQSFWHCMDTYKDYQDLNRIWEESHPWKLWQT